MRKLFRWQTPPEDLSSIKVSKTETADIVIIGAGQSGTCAARAAIESDASVIVIEQQAEESQRILGIGEIGHINSKWQSDRGVPKVDIAVFVNDWQLRTNNRSDVRLIRKFAENCGDCFDWFVEVLSPDERDAIHPMLTPQSPYFPKTLNGIHAWSGTAHMGLKLQNKAVKLNQQIAKENGARFFFNTKAQSLIKHCSKVDGVVAKNAAGEYVSYIATKGVILAAGDYSKNLEMCEDLLTEAADLIDDGTDWSGHGWDGSGIQIGVWAGGRLEPRSHAALGGNYSFPGFEVIGSTAILRVNKYGKRFSDEGFGTHVLAALAGAKQPNGILWGIFDNDIFKQIEYQSSSHAVFDYSKLNKIEQLKTQLESALSAGKDGFSTGKNGIMYAANTIEELADILFDSKMAKADFISTVYHYNKLCENGIDTDFGKDKHLLQPIVKAPFFACGQIKDSRNPSGQSMKLLVTVSGLMINENQQVVDDDFEPIEGLFATGNCSGGRFGFQYCTSLPGQSISMAHTLGREVGKHLAKL